MLKLKKNKNMADTHYYVHYMNSPRKTLSSEEAKRIGAECDPTLDTVFLKLIKSDIDYIKGLKSMNGKALSMALSKNEKDKKVLSENLVELLNANLEYYRVAIESFEKISLPF